ncbi:ATP-binding cassette domain-containing protein [Lactiplantibacillus mudanjiangensis]|uniref:ABC transporter ATP-binding protein [Lactobacillus sp.] n=1 Tax=Lactiplantibacillus mudanjiangensis TaxID=1296538 RepID=A0A660E3L9_9LACO|nr:ABC transporter ATP-binding protein [Lactiplantibacillus mudanjiangensis]VDG18951.1 ABC transporter ATP-binding protein [Lactobacillus sp.] [Lactiplantibacillus mudanjiangensis]VDG25272.1 ABC transporter ATP-binding protein [Lactobacillus sp.] [Lactiplantibacillus mudanjiangensis]VDG27475.1 ABC transporter ATP-binding protein [Lactobacillus sp.] [Lactiplantibacillus mudanjiangensis]VDG33052.1 ABC transporter ATP-binding protein [Lactobacillus sp.] [Lactiplantibacillus mudanjiangensis]
MTDILKIENLTYKRNQRLLLQDVNLTLTAGKIVGLLGENGAGKTTLMRLITGSAQGHGTIMVSGTQTPTERKSHLSFSEQLRGFNRNTKVAQVVAFYHTVYPDFDPQRFHELAGFLQIDVNLRLGALSKGMREKLIIALTLARQVDLYLLDEPFSGIDSMSRKKIISSIIQWMPEEATLLISDHYVTEIAPILDEIVVVKDQTIAVHRAADEIRSESGMDIEDYYESLYEGGVNRD